MFCPSRRALTIPVLAQQGQLLRHRRLFHVDEARQFGHRALLLHQLTEQQALGVAERLHQLAHLAGRTRRDLASAYLQISAIKQISASGFACAMLTQADRPVVKARKLHGKERKADGRERFAVGTTRPTWRLISGWVRSRATASEGMPSTWISDLGTMLEEPAERTWAQRLTTELVSSCGRGEQSSDLKMASMMRRFCMLGVSKQSGSSAACRQVATRAVPSGPCSGVSST